MYGLLAVALLALAGVSEATRLGIGSILDDNNIPAEVKKEGFKSVKIVGDKVVIDRRESGTLEIEDAKLARNLHELSMQGGVYKKNKRTGVTQVKNLFVRDSGCDFICGQGANTCSTENNGVGQCFCLKDCGPEAEECFSTCYPPATST